MNLKEVVQWMLENKYLAVVNNKYRVTAKFNKEMTGIERGLMMTGNGPLVIEQSLTLSNTKEISTGGTINWTDQYIKFIVDAEVPARCESSSGSYDVGKYSEDGMKAFRKAIEKDGVVYGILVKSTMLYYKTHKKFALKIGNYMADGAWRSDYEALKASAENGDVSEHIKKEIDGDKEFSKFKLG
jgi:hypothetical protein